MARLLTQGPRKAKAGQPGAARLTEFRFRAAGEGRVGGVVLPGNPLIDGAAKKAPVAADFKGGNLFLLEQPVDEAVGTVEVEGEGRDGHDLLGLEVD